MTRGVPVELPAVLRSFELYLNEHGESSATAPIDSPQRRDWRRRWAHDFGDWCERNNVDDREAFNQFRAEQLAAMFAADPDWWDRLQMRPEDR